MLITSLRWTLNFELFLLADLEGTVKAVKVTLIFYYFYYWWGGTKSIGTAATSGLLYKPQMIDEDDYGAISTKIVTLIHIVVKHYTLSQQCYVNDNK
jgi:hypothetical protein